MAERNSSAPEKSEDCPQKCEVCHIIFPDTNAYVDHLESKKHIKGIMKKKYGAKYLEAKANMLGTKVDKEKEHQSDTSDTSDEDACYPCEVCQKVCTGILNYNLHLEGKKHRNKVKEVKILKQMQMDKSIKDDNADDDDSLINAIFTKNEYSSTEIHCKICNKTCPGPAAFQQHINSKSHKTKLTMKNLTENNEYEKHAAENSENEDDNFAKCDICSKIFSGPLPYNQHMNSATHKKQVKQSGELMKLKDLAINFEETNQIQCKECSKYFSGPKPFMDHLKSSVHSKLKQKNDLLKTLQEKYPEMVIRSIVDGEDECTTISCSICHTIFSGPESARDHFRSQKHIKVGNAKMKYEKFKRLQNGKQSSTKSKSEVDIEIFNSDDDDELIKGFNVV